MVHLWFLHTLFDMTGSVNERVHCAICALVPPLVVASNQTLAGLFGFRTTKQFSVADLFNLASTVLCWF